MAARKTTASYNFNGEGTIMGGLFVIAQGGKVEFKHLEMPFGHFASTEEVCLRVLSPVCVLCL
jgi:hypothetical protein